MKEKQKIRTIKSKHLGDFFELFSTLVKTEFPEYSQKTKEYFLLSDKAWSKKRYRKILKAQRGFLLGAWVDKRLVGFIDANLPFGGVSFCTWLGVDQAFRCYGIGKALIQAWEVKAKAKGAHSLLLYGDKRNIEFYKRAGFALIGIWPQSYFGADSWILTKRILQAKEENFLRDLR